MAKKSGAAGVPPITLSLKVDLDSANDKVRKELGSLSQTLGQFYQSTGAASNSSAMAGAVGAVSSCRCSNDVNSWSMLLSLKILLLV